MTIDTPIQSKHPGLKQKVNLQRLLTTAFLMALLLSYSLLWIRMITDPLQYTGADFITFYTAGTIGQSYGLGRVYDFNLQKSTEESVVGYKLDPTEVLPHNHLPFINSLLVQLVSITGGKYIPGFIVWEIMNLAIYILAVITISKLFTDRIPGSFLTKLSYLLFYPIFVSLLTGQDTALLVLGAVGLFYGVLRQKDWVAGLGLALMTVRPHIALVLALPFLFRRRGIWWWFFGGALVLAGISLIQLGRGGITDFLSILFDTMGRSRETAMVNFIGLAVRALPFIDPVFPRIVGWILYFAMMALLCLVWRKQSQIDGRLLSLAVLASLFVAPHLVYHDLALLLLPLLWAIGSALELKWIHQKQIPLIILTISVVLLLSFVTTSVFQLFSYLLMAFLGIVLWNPQSLGKQVQRLFMHNRLAV